MHGPHMSCVQVTAAITGLRRRWPEERRRVRQPMLTALRLQQPLLRQCGPREAATALHGMAKTGVVEAAVLSGCLERLESAVEERPPLEVWGYTYIRVCALV